MYTSQAVVYLTRQTRNYCIYQSSDLKVIHYERRQAGHDLPDVLIVNARTPTKEDLSNVVNASPAA